MIFNPEVHKGPGDIPPFRLLSSSKKTIPDDIVIIEKTTLSDVFDCLMFNQTGLVPEASSCHCTLISEKNSGREAAFYKIWAQNCRVIRFCASSQESKTSSSRHGYSHIYTSLWAAFKHFNELDATIENNPLPVWGPSKGLKDEVQLVQKKPVIRLHPIAAKPLPLP